MKKIKSLFNVSKQGIFNTIVFLASTVGFLYQTSLAWEEYFEYNTISVLKLEHDPILNYPSVTICAGEMIPDYVLFDWYPEYKCITTDPNCTTKSTLNRYQLHRQYEEKAFQDRPLWQLIGQIKKPIPYCDLEMLPMIHGGNGRIRYTDAIQSLSFNLNTRCFTFFSRLNIGKLKDYKLNYRIKGKLNIVIFLSKRKQISRLVSFS
jgi:Amiloride-sensitive sodium channel